MNFSKMKWKHVAGKAIGSYVGAGLGLSAAGVQIASSLTAPISYPVLGFIVGAIADPEDPGDGAIKHAVMGSLAVPLAPLFLMTVPVTITLSTLGGTVIGALASEHLFKDNS